MIVELVVEKVVSHGEGLARYNNEVVFISDVLPGEHITVELREEKKGLYRGTLLSIDKPSSHRVTPPCPYYGVCGGCDFQYVESSYQVELKEEIVKENLKRIGKVDYRYTFLPSEVDHPWAYRHRVKFHRDEQSGAIGFLGRKSHTVIDIASCPILVENLNRLLSEKREILQQQRSSTIEVLSNQRELSFDDTTIPFYLNGKTIYGSGNLFFQSHASLIEPMITFVQKHTEGDHIVDLYSGVGMFAAFVESADNNVVAVERDKKALNVAKKNLSYTTFFTQKSESWARSHSLAQCDTLIVDPPRVGIDNKVIQAIGKLQPKKIIYVSCNSATLARDIHRLRTYGYVTEIVQLFDLYPQTTHVETIVLMSRVKT